MIKKFYYVEINYNFLKINLYRYVRMKKKTNGIFRKILKLLKLN